MRDISLQNVSNLVFDLSRSLKVKSNGAVGLPIYDFPLVSNSNYMSNSHHVGVIATGNIFLLSLIIRAKFRPTHTHAYPGESFIKIESLHPWVHGKHPMKNEVDRLNTFCAMLLADTHTQTDIHTHKAIA